MIRHAWLRAVTSDKISKLMQIMHLRAFLECKYGFCAPTLLLNRCTCPCVYCPRLISETVVVLSWVWLKITSFDCYASAITLLIILILLLLLWSVGKLLHTRGKSEKRAFCFKDARCSCNVSMPLLHDSLPAFDCTGWLIVSILYYL